MRKTKGIVLKVKKGTCIVATRGREFHEVALPDRVPLIGEEIMVDVNPVQRARRLFSLRFAGVAVLIVALLIAPWFSSQLTALFAPGLAEAAPAAYVAVDVNPSFELGVDEDGKVISVNPFNDDAVNLLEDLDLVGMDLDEALAAFTDAAIQQGYLASDKDNVVLLGVVLTDDGVQVNFDPLPAYEAVNKHLEDHGLTGLVHMRLGTPEEREAGNEDGLSLNRQAFVDELGISVDEAAHTSLPDLIAQVVAAHGDQEPEAAVQAFLDDSGISGKHKGWFGGVLNALQKQQDAQTRFMQRLEERANNGDVEPGSDNGNGKGKDKENNGRGDTGRPDQAPGQTK